MSDEHFRRLIRCLDLESEEESRLVSERSRREIGPNAERHGDCLIGLAIRDETAGFGGRAVLVLGKKDQRLELPWTRLNPGTPIVLTEEQSSRTDFQRGVVTDKDRHTITVAIADSPEPANDRPTFRVDLASDEIARQRQREALNVARATERGRLATLKRRLLGEDPPVFQPLTPFKPLSPLDASQLAAVQLALSAQDLAIIHGPPGTGKTTTVVELIRQAIRRGERVLACAPSNLGVDNLLERLLESGERALRIGHPARVLPALRARTLDVQVESHESLKLARAWTKEAFALRRQASKYTRSAPPPGARRDLRAEARKLLDDARQLESNLVNHLLDSATVICATLTGVNAGLLGDRQFDLLVIDEAAQATEPTCWIPLQRSHKVVLAGDHCQLPPTVVSPQARQNGLHVSMMERLMEQGGSGISFKLTTQYRMHHQIMQFSSGEFYNSELIAAESVREHLLMDLPNVSASSLTETAIRFIDTAGSSCEEAAEEQGSSLHNQGEAEFVVRQVEQLIATGLSAADIAVITPYSAQARCLRDLIENPAVEVDTIDGFQGREKEAVVISLVRSNPRGEVGFLADTRRLNVALTRARRHLIVIGDSSTLANHEFYLRLLEYFEHADAYGTVWDFDQN